MAQPTPERPVYPGQQTKTLYAQKIRRRRPARKHQQRRSGANHKRILLWVGVLLAIFLLLWLR